MNRPLPLCLISLLAAAPLSAAGLGAHQHGVAQLDIAQEGKTLELAFHSPLDNLVGFEHQPRTEAEHQALEQAEAVLKQGDSLFLPPEGAGCTLAAVELHNPFADANHDDEHQHEHKAHEDEHHDEHAAHDDEHHDEHVAHEEEHHHGHDAHEDKHHDEHAAHDDEHHEHDAHHDEHKHDKEGSHHADLDTTWRFECSAPQQLGQFETRLFTEFPALQELKVQSFNARGQRSQKLSAEQHRIELP